MTVKRFGIAVWLLVCGFCFWVPQNAQAVALAESSISFTNLHITSIDPQTGKPVGTVELLPWYMEAYAEARNSLGELKQDFHNDFSPATVPPADAAVTWAKGHGDVAAPNDPPDLNVAANANTQQVLIPDHIKDAWAASQGRGTLANAFMVTGGIGLVEVNFLGIVDYFLHVLTTNNGVYAETETTFTLEVFGLPLINNELQDSIVLFFHDHLAIGPNSEDRRQDSEVLFNERQVFVEFGKAYSFVLESDSESYAVVPEPSTIALMLLSLGILAGFVRKQCSITRFVKSN